MTSSSTIYQILAQTDLFADLDEAHIMAVAAIGDLIALDAGEQVFSENAASDEMYVIGRGIIEILVDPNMLNQESHLEPIIIARLLPGDLLGEMALVDQGLRSATARAGEADTFLVRIPRQPLLDLCRQQPDLGFVLMYSLAADMALKIRNTGLTLRQYQLALTYRSKQ